MTDPERDHLLSRIGHLECANRRWKWLALAGTPLLALLLLLAGASTVASWVTLRDVAHREWVERERMREAEEQALRDAEEALRRVQQAEVEKWHWAEVGLDRMPPEP
jgi:hypothetical protein